MAARICALALACAAAFACVEWGVEDFMGPTFLAPLGARAPPPSAPRAQTPAVAAPTGELAALPVWASAAAGVMVGLLMALVNGPMEAYARPWPAEPDGMQSFRQHVGSLQTEPELTDLQRQSIQEAWLPQTQHELRVDTQRKIAADQPSQRALRLERNLERLRELASDTEIPA